MENVYKFVKWEVAPLENYKDTKVYIFMEKLNAGQQLTKEEKNELFKMLQNYNSSVHLMGWCYDFTKYLKLYLVKIKYDGWREVYAFNKTQIRERYKSYVLNIIEL